MRFETINAIVININLYILLKLTLSIFLVLDILKGSALKYNNDL